MRTVAWIAWCALLLVVAGAVVVAELDRASRRDARIAERVPAPFRSFAQEQITLARIKAGDKDGGLSAARTLVRRRPIPADNLFLLAVANNIAGHSKMADEVLGVSAVRGWRVPQIQLAMIYAALANGKVDVASARLLALWETGSDDDVLAQPVSAVFAAPGGPEAFGRSIASSHTLTDSIVQRMPQFVSPSAYMRMIDASVAAGRRFGCAQLQLQAAAFQQAGNQSDSQKLQQLACRAS